ncbi:mesenchyme-specific cell surface glycoprotein-like isoform X2 [Mercenaria mercenaria]|uniref:mesenchyme-specific cell surface glycoprotein-like isoform X2 n=1 Tax=Mercenaria mercenaria TaxID=6596 RepID=UPI00234F800F|nr:mesenchyme-specific cell surface glycoprotein-like isoform X2 [Mercenaria mercenaria]
MGVTTLILAAFLLQTVFGYYTLKQLSYTQLATGSSRGSYVYGGLNLGTATDAAYDFVNNIVYIIGEKSHYMHVVDIADPSNPKVLFIHEFTKGEGVPRSIDICGDEIAVALAAQTDINEGHVRYYHTYTKNSGATDMTLDGYVTVGPHPNHLKFTDDCGTVIVANEGIAGKDEAGKYMDPEGSITIIHGEKTGNPSVRLVDFSAFNTGQPNYNQNLRTPSLYIPSSMVSPMTTVAQDVEPEYVTISSDGRTAYVTLQENNAVAVIDINNGVVSSINPLPRKLWTTSTNSLDASDRDGGVHRRTFSGLQSLRQPGVIKSLQVNRKKYLFTADTGAVKSFTSSKHGFSWTDMAAAKSLSKSIDTTLTDLVANVNNDEMLGRLQVSTVDGKNMFSQKFQHLEAFGGRGFSIWDASYLNAPIYDSDGALEEYMEAYDKSVFNTDYISNLYYQSPEQHRDAVSYRQGAQVTGLDVAEDNGTIFLVAGTWSTGTLFVYTVDVSSGQPVPQFNSVVRSGAKDYPWRDLYQNLTLGTVGDLYISDLGIIPSEHSPTDSPLLYVISTGAGALSVYSIEKQTTTIPGSI